MQDLRKSFSLAAIGISVVVRTKRVRFILLPSMTFCLKVRPVARINPSRPEAAIQHVSQMHHGSVCPSEICIGVNRAINVANFNLDSSVGDGSDVYFLP